MKIEDAAKSPSLEGEIGPLKLEDFTERKEGDIYLSREGNLRLFYHSEGFITKPQSKSYLKHSYRDLVTGELGAEEERGNEDIFKIKKYHLVNEEELPWIIHFANKQILSESISSTRVADLPGMEEITPRITTVDLNIEDVDRIAKGS
ncbi:hypothetical protein ISS08_01555 [Candidatus Pacearchaeota archaeon]|nr:hypothetical protein [Candidatus Pacearchaeota archaeon]